MKAGMVLYIRNDIRVSDNQIGKSIFEEHLNYLMELSKTRTLVGGGYVNEAGGMVIFEATDLVEAHELCMKDPIIQSGCFSYELKEWELVIVSKGD